MLRAVFWDNDEVTDQQCIYHYVEAKTQRKLVEGINKFLSTSQGRRWLALEKSMRIMKV